MSVHDDAFLDAVAVLALGALPADEAAAVAAHLSGCETCRREYADLRAAADALGYAAEAAPDALDELASARLKAGVMRAVRADVARDGAPAVAPPAARVSARPAWVVYAALAASLALAVGEAFALGGYRSEHRDDVNRIATLQAAANASGDAAARALAERNALAGRIAAIVAPGSKHYAIANGEVIESGGRIYLAFAHLAPTPAGKVYQAWTFARGSSRPIPSVTFVADASGTALVALPGSSAGLAAVAVTVEKTGGSPVPTSKPTLVQALS